MQTGIIKVFGNNKYNFYKQIYDNVLVGEFYRKVGSNEDLQTQLQAEIDYNNYRGGRNARKNFLKGDLDAFSEMVSYKIPFKNKEFKLLRGLIDTNEQLLLRLNNARFTLTHENLKKGGLMYNSLKNMYNIEYVEEFGSDQVKAQVIKGIKEAEITRTIRPKKNKIRRNKNGRFFKALNTTNIDLTRYQIIKDESQLDIIQEHCIIKTLLNAGISTDICNRVKLTFTSAYEFPRCKLFEVANIIEHKIILYFVKDNKSSDNKIFNNQIYGKFDKTIKMALYNDHYFIFEDVEYSLYSVKNYDKVKDQKDWHLITKQKTNGNFTREKTRFNKINSLELIYYLDISNKFIKSSILKLLDVRQKEIYLDEIEKEQNLFEIKESKFLKVPVVFYADTETDVTGEEHKLLYFGIINKTDKEPFLFTDDYKNNFYKYIYNTLKKLPKLKFGEGVYCPVVYFHNVKYDFAVIKELFIIHSICDKNGSLYSIKIGLESNYNYISKEIEIVDSYKMISIPLSKFNNTFSLGPEMDKKEAIAYTYYNDDTKYKTVENIENYIEHLNPKLKDIFINNIINNDFEYNEINKTFNPYKYYLYYLKYDVLVLRAGLEVLKNKMYDLTGLNINNILTISSLVDRSFKNKDCYKDVYSLKGNIRDFISSAIYGGRVAVNEKFILQELNGQINDYDAVSLYPSAISRMAREMGIPTGPAKKIIDTNYNIIKHYIYYVVKIKINKINKKQQIPFIGVKKDGILNYINDAGEGFITTVDKITLEDYIEFHQIEFEIIEGVYYNEGTNKIIGTVIDNLFQDRITYKKIMKNHDSSANEYESADITQNLIKLMLNSVYGKTIIKKTDSHKLIKANGENLEDYIYNNYNTIKTITYLNKDQSIIEQNGVDDSSNFAHVGCLILSYSKRMMNEVMGLANDNDINIYYQDTDSMHLDNKDIPKLEKLYFEKYNKVIRGDNMGQFHSDFSLKGAKKGAEILATTSIFLGKKCYMDVLESINDNGETIQDVHIRLKGITQAGVNHKINYYMQDQKLNKVEAVKYMFNRMIAGEKMAFILNPKNDKVMFKYHSMGVSTCQEVIRILDYSDDTEIY